MENKNNAECPICGKGFKVCRTCSEHDLFSWKTVTDTEACFNVFTILHKYNVMHTLTKDEAKEKLEKCDLTELNTYPNHIKKLITSIITADVETKKDTDVMPAKAKSEKVTETKAYRKAKTTTK